MLSLVYLKVYQYQRDTLETRQSIVGPIVRRNQLPVPPPPCFVNNASPEFFS